jgi:hypothetical protein
MQRVTLVPAIALSVALDLSNAAGGLAQQQAGTRAKEAASAATGLPADYRRSIAQYIRAHNRYVVRDAKISQPYERYGGLFRGGTFTAVCVAVFRDNPFGIVVRDNWVLAFEQGQIKQVAMGMESCSDLSPFPELASR